MTTSKPPSRAASIARRAICTGDWPATIGSVSTPTCLPSTASCSIAAGRRVSSEAISTRRLPRSVRRLAILAVVVVLPEPCSPTIRTGTGGTALRSMVPASSPSIVTSSSWTIFTTIWPGVTELQHLGADGARAHLVGERAHHLERDVGLEQRAADLAQGRVDVLLGQRAAARELVEDA